MRLSLLHREVRIVPGAADPADGHPVRAGGVWAVGLHPRKVCGRQFAVMKCQSGFYWGIRAKGNGACAGGSFLRGSGLNSRVGSPVSATSWRKTEIRTTT